MAADDLRTASDSPETSHGQSFEKLKASVRGDVHVRGDPQFLSRTRLFNGNVLCESQAVVLPLDAKDVSKTVLFCRKHGLSLSVKAGGYGIHGGAINGQVIVDLSNLDDIDVEPPLPDTDGLGYTPLSEMVPANSKGKGKASSTAIKRPREETLPPIGSIGHYDSASSTIASFLRGTALPPDNADDPPRQPPTNRRRVEGEPLSAIAVSERQASSGSDNSHVSDTSTRTVSSSAATSVGSKSPPLPPQTQAQPQVQSRNVPSRVAPGPPSPVLAHDPFGYLAEDGPRPTRHISSTNPLLTSPIAPPRSPPLSSNAAYSSSDPRAPPMAGSSSSSSSAPYPAPLNVDSDIWGPAAAAIFSHPLFDPSAHFARNTAGMTPVHKQAYVTFGSGANQKAVDQHTADNPLEAVSLTGDRGVVPYHVPFSAHPVGSSVMLLGGFGFLSRLYGLAIDNLVEVEVVLADGSVVIANEREHSDLWWAMRGAGPAFGIATRYKARAFPVPVVFAGNLIYRFHRATAPSLIKHFRDCVKGAPRELYANLILTAGPADKDSLVVIQMCYVGPRAGGQDFLQAISSWGGEACLLKDVEEKRFLLQQDSVAQVLRGRAGNQWFIRSVLASSLPDDIINKTVTEFADTPIGCTWLFELAGGAITDVEQSCIPKTQREAAFTIAALHQWEMGIDDPRCVETAEEWLSETVGRVALGGPIPSFLGRHEDPHRVIKSYGDNWGKLVSLKKKYDPDCFLSSNFWPLDTRGNVIDPNAHEPKSPTF